MHAFILRRTMGGRERLGGPRWTRAVLRMAANGSPGAPSASLVTPEAGPVASASARAKTKTVEDLI